MDKILLPYKGLDSDNQCFTFNAGEEFFVALANPEIITGEVEIVIKTLKINAGVKLNIKISGKVEVECDRCLENCPIQIESQSELAVREGENSEQYDEQTMWISATDSEIDLTQYIYESIVLALPYQRVHGTDENGELLCNKEMLAKFSIVTDEEFEKIISPKADKQNDPDWSKLEELKAKLSK